MKQLALPSIFRFRFLPLELPFDYDAGEQVISSDILVSTENAVFTDDGRYFVAGKHSELGWGIYEIVRTATSYDVKQVAPGILQVGATRHACWFDGLTTDGRYLYATAAVHPDDNFMKTDYGAFFRVLPREDTADISIAQYEKNELRAYNGMAVGADGSIYMTNSSALTDGSGVAIYKVILTDEPHFTIQLAPWLLANVFRDTKPNGLQIQNDTMFYVSGKGLYIIRMTPSGPGFPIPVYITYLLNNLLDDLVLLPDNRVAVAEIDAVAVTTSMLTGVPVPGINQIVIVDLESLLLQKKIVLTSPYTVSSLAYDENSVMTAGKLLATDWVHGGIRQLECVPRVRERLSR